MTGSFRRVLERHDDGLVEVFHWDEPSHTFAIEYRQEVDSVLTLAREKAADTGGWNKSRDMQSVAVVPTVVQMEMVRRYGQEVIKNTQLMRRALDDPEWRYLRIARVIA